MPILFAQWRFVKDFLIIFTINLYFGQKIEAKTYVPLLTSLLEILDFFIQTHYTYKKLLTITKKYGNIYKFVNLLL